MIYLKIPLYYTLNNRIIIISSLDFSIHKWIDDPNKQIVSLYLSQFPPIPVMGAGTKTLYKPNWNEDEARAAVLVQLNITPDMIKSSKRDSAGRVID